MSGARKQKEEKLRKLIPEGGFLKTTSRPSSPMPRDKRSALIRRGNELFNQGRYDLAKRIFITTGYSDGLIRLGDMHYEKRDALEALRMYRLAPQKQKVDSMVEKMAWIIQSWLNECQEGHGDGRRDKKGAGGGPAQHS